MIRLELGLPNNIPMDFPRSPAPQSNETVIDSDSFSDGLGSVLKELQLQYKNLNKLRKIFYGQSQINNLIDDSEELVGFLIDFLECLLNAFQQPTELNNFMESMYEIFRLEPRLCIQFISENVYLKELPSSERVSN